MNAPGRARTYNLRFRRPTLYPIELRVRCLGLPDQALPLTLPTGVYRICWDRQPDEALLAKFPVFFLLLARFQTLADWDAFAAFACFLSRHHSKAMGRTETKMIPSITSEKYFLTIGRFPNT